MYQRKETENNPMNNFSQEIYYSENTLHNNRQLSKSSMAH